MSSRKRPVSVILIACLYIVVGTLALISHFPNVRTGVADTILVELVELVAIVSGVFLLRAQNWARWLAVAWMGFHVILSLRSPRELIVHSLFFVLIAWLLFRADATRYF